MGTSTISGNRHKASKATKSALAVVLALALALGGTFAWMHVTRAATNEFAGFSNPGGRLHDDFVWTSTQKNKDIYVENFTSGEEGENIYVRVQLKEYLEVGGTSYPTGATVSDHSTWAKHHYNVADEGAENKFHNYFDFTYGGQTTYMPTFNMNKDSLDPDVNGSYRDAGGPFTSYKDYGMLVAGNGNSYSETRDAYYDADTNDVDERMEGSLSAPGAGGAEGENYVAKEETHAAKNTRATQAVIPMSTWNGYTDEQKKVGYWVYDTDGWAYWSQALKPGEATGLLLDNVTRTDTTIGDDWYYAIDAIGEFATSDAWYKEGEGDAATYYFGREGGEGHTMTQDACNLLKNAATNVGGTLTGMPSWVNDVKAASTANAAAAAAGGDTTAAVVTIAGVDYVKLAQTESGTQALLMRKNLLSGARAFDSSSNSWASADLRAYLNADYELSLPADLKNRLIQANIKTKQQIDSTDFIETSDKVFLLTEADVCGTTREVPRPTADYFTYGNESLVPDSLRVAVDDSGSARYWWLRSPRAVNISAADVSPTGVVSNNGYMGEIWVRPAFWVNLDS